MSEYLDMDTIYRQERRRWLKEEAPRKSIRDVIGESVPYWIILVAAVLYGLSAPHTAGVFDKLTPGWGWVAPVGVEFGLLYAAFRRRLARAKQEILRVKGIQEQSPQLEAATFAKARALQHAHVPASLPRPIDKDALAELACSLRWSDIGLRAIQVGQCLPAEFECSQGVIQQIVRQIIDQAIRRLPNGNHVLKLIARQSGEDHTRIRRAALP